MKLLCDGESGTGTRPSDQGEADQNLEILATRTGVSGEKQQELVRGTEYGVRGGRSGVTTVHERRGWTLLLGGKGCGGRDIAIPRLL